MTHLPLGQKTYETRENCTISITNKNEKKQCSCLHDTPVELYRTINSKLFENIS